MVKNLPLATFTALLFWGWNAPIRAGEANDAPMLERGSVRFIAAGGIVVLDRMAEFWPELSLEVGLADRLMLAAPLYLSIRLVDLGSSGSLYLGAGIADMYIDDAPKLLYSPSAALAAWVRMGSEAALRAAFDVTGAESGLRRGDHGVWLRGAAALLIDFGPWATIGIGCAYQRNVVEGFHPPDLDKVGWVGGSRISIFSVSTEPFSTLPLLSVHMQPFMDLIAITRFDVNMDTNTTDSRFLLGIALAHE